MVLSEEHPNRIIYCSPHPVLVPEGSHELHGTIDNVVFNTGVDRRDDLGTPDRFDVYYGMADDRIGVARLDVPATLPQDRAAGYSRRRAVAKGIREQGQRVGTFRTYRVGAVHA